MSVCRICAAHPGWMRELEADPIAKTMVDTDRLVTCFCQRPELVRDEGEGKP